MAVTIDRIKHGVLDYCEKEFVVKAGGLSKWMVAILLPSIVECTMNEFVDGNREVLHNAGFLTDDGMVNVDAIYNDAIKVAEKYGSVNHNIKMLGTVTFTKDDINELYYEIMK